MRGKSERVKIDAGRDAQILVPLDQQAMWMARQGMRYGDPEQPRYATGRADGRAPALNAGVDFTLRTRGAGGQGETHPSGKLAQPKRRS